MKKIYQKPETVVVYVKAEAMLSSSPTQSVNVGSPYSGGGIGAKDRGDYEPEEEPTFGDLW
ncbi:MAG: hypothetical protein IJT97_09085 [Bacteroidaceae bacterium]|nr:hypothetical protein [Bacteroidaceae bacterium]